MLGWLAAVQLAVAEPREARAVGPKPAVQVTRRRRPRYKNLKRPKGPSGPTLERPGWRPEVKAALEKLIRDRGDKSKGYSADWPPVAVVMLDDVAVEHSIGELAFLRLVERVEFRLTDAWWNRIPADFRDKARRDYKRFSSRAEAAWPQDEDYLDFRKQLVASYALLCRRDGRRACRTWLTALLAGFTEAEMEAYLRETVDEALREPLTTDEIRAHAGDESPVPVERGLRRIPAMEELARRLLASGFDVWAFSSSNQWAAEAVATRYGIDPSRVVGVRTRVLNQRLAPEVIDPVPIGPGAAEAVVVFIGRDPALVIASAPDASVLEHGKGLRVAIDRGDAMFDARAKDRGWLLQPMLPAGPAESK